AYQYCFFQAEDGIRDATVTGVQTCALPISAPATATPFKPAGGRADGEETAADGTISESNLDDDDMENWRSLAAIEAELKPKVLEIGRASCRERVRGSGGGVCVAGGGSGAGG